MESYLSADRAEQEQEARPANWLKNAGITGASLFGGASILSRALPLLSQFVPENLALKGFSKLDPRLGRFAKQATEAGYTFNEIKDFLKSKSEEESRGSENKNIIQMYSPQLHEFLTAEIEKGRAPLEAGALAQLQKPFQADIKKITQEHKAPFSAILETVYGSGKKSPNKEDISEQNLRGDNSKKSELAQLSNQILEALQKMRGNG